MRVEGRDVEECDKVWGGWEDLVESRDRLVVEDELEDPSARRQTWFLLALLAARTRSY